MATKKKTKEKIHKLSEKDFLRLEKRFEELRNKEMDFYMEYLKSPWKLFTRSLLVGTGKGLGFFLGSAIIITILSYVLNTVLGDIPEIGTFFKNLNTWLSENINN